LAYSVDKNDLVILDSGTGTSPDSSAQVRKVKKKVDINSADSLALLELTGIGPSFARRILKYRSMLGGFVTVDQLKEVYGMDSARLQGFIHEIKIDTSKLKKLDVNQASFKELLAHPYLEYEQVKAIARFRDRKGLLDSPGQLLAAGVLPDSLWFRLSPYLIAGKDSSIIRKEFLEK
jgi:competence ComEA-like helix-hairpin-helix protein